MEQKLSFNKIRELVDAETTNALAHRMVEEMTFSTNYDRVVRELQQTDEMRQILLMENSFPSQDFFDLSEELTRLKVGNTVIDPEALVDFKASLHTLTLCLRFFNAEAAEKYPELTALASRIDLDPNILKRIDKIVDDKGEIFDNASPQLLEIRRSMLRKRSEVDAQIGRSLSRAKREGWAPENAEVTIRNGRLVIPMLDTHRRKMKGLIHDESATRQTAFLEPAEVVELNNDLRELEFAERHEIQKILAAFTDFFRPQLTQLINAYWFLGRIDFIRAKARFALNVGCIVPKVHNRPMMGWIEARHPLLVLSHREQGKEVVPFDLALDSQAPDAPHDGPVPPRILIISGPNAGGKSVCLKAVGLIQYMLQCGLPVPCRETSEFGIFDRVSIDIGDQQSLENDLSTYSSHLQNMKALLAVADRRTLFLLDELGGGTEPRSGCAIAEALLEELYRRGSFGVVTTHFADLKLLADRYEAIQNGAMLFDTERMMPLYRLSVGHPGSSFAFEIATKIGFPLDILEAAESKVGSEMLNFEHQLQQIELDKQEIARQRTELQVSDSFLNEVITKYQQLNEKLESRRYDIISEARQQARQIIADANRTVERTIADIKEANAERERTQKAREEMRRDLEKIEKQQAEYDRKRDEERRRNKAAAQEKPVAAQPDEDTEEEVASGPLQVGDIVRIDGGDTFGQLMELKGKKAVVESNSLRMTIPLDRLAKTAKKRIPSDKSQHRTGRFQSIYDEINEKRSHFNPTLDLRGHRAEEALAELQHFLDEAQLLGERELRILHGKGYGILKTLIRQQLQSNHDVVSFHSASLETGGEGVTVVHL
ncbi:MAG: Smr/MutS family protein [Bacteroidales bacterium]|nr:Smr/MutS family protein [Bacteroidales bacterium]